MLGYFVASIVRQTLTWTTGSLMCVGDVFVIYKYSLTLSFCQTLQPSKIFQHTFRMS